jgi:hypothetical protein
MQNETAHALHYSLTSCGSGGKQQCTLQGLVSLFLLSYLRGFLCCYFAQADTTTPITVLCLQGL